MSTKVIISIIFLGAAVVILGTDALFFGTVTDAIDKTTMGMFTGTSGTIPPDIAVASNAFAIDLYRQISDGDGNVFFSPVSVYAVLSMLGEGAKGETADQIQGALGLEPDAGLRHSQTAMLMSSLNWTDQHTTLTVANSLWLAAWFEPYDSYVDIIRDTYQADINSVNFLGDGVDRINEWAAEKTQDRIKNVLNSLDPATAAVVLNAIYFKGAWAEQFPAEDTHESDFWTGAAEVRADFMSVYAQFDYVRSDEAHILKMPYRGERLSMLVLLPLDRDGIGRLEEAVTPEQIEQWRRGLQGINLVVVMPKFEIRTHYKLAPHLESLGVTHLFDRHAVDLSGIANVGENLHVDQILQDAYIMVNEEGTEAAAVTAAVLQSRLHLVMDHPFMFLIQDDKSGAILFVGRVSDPS